MVLFNNCFVILFLTAYFLGMLYLNFSAIKANKIEKKMDTLEVISAEYSLALVHTEKQQVAQVRTVFSWLPIIKSHTTSLKRINSSILPSSDPSGHFRNNNDRLG